MSRWFTLTVSIELQHFVGGPTFDNVEPSAGGLLTECRWFKSGETDGAK
jgi:hypothetical protein